MNTDIVLHKYLRQFRLMDGNRYYHIDAIELAFRLALDELDASTPSTDVHTTEQLGSANLRIMELQADLERLQTAANAEVAELRQQIAQMDADNAALIRRNRELGAALDIATGAAPAVAKPVAVHANGHTNGAQPPISNPPWGRPQYPEHPRRRGHRLVDRLRRRPPRLAHRPQARPTAHGASHPQLRPRIRRHEDDRL